MNPRVYLAGPDVFLPDPHGWAARRRAICAVHGLDAINPLDRLPDEATSLADLPEWRRIALRNEAHIHGCDAVIANLTPFRGPSADVGTVYEIGLARALGRLVFGYANVAEKFSRRSFDFAATHGGAIIGRGGVWRDGDGMLIEQFGLFDNLMIEAAVVASGGALVLEEADPTQRWSDLTAFERCVVLAAEALEARTG
jgi:nucleoside 2-deoxyribosyltransferase